MKDYTNWHKEKTTIENSDRNIPNFEEGEIWWCSIGSNIGQEQDGKNESFERPVLILKKFNKEVAWAVCITGAEKEGPYYHSFTEGKTIFTVILSQIRLLSAKRLCRFIVTIQQDRFLIIKKKIIALFD